MQVIFLASGVSGPPLIGVDTAVLILLCAAVLYLLKSQYDTRRAVAALQEMGPVKSKSPAVVPVQASGSLAGDPTPEIRAAIAAAISVTLGREHRVVSVAPAMLWSQEGRRQVFQSHRVR